MSAIKARERAIWSRRDALTRPTPSLTCPGSWAEFAALEAPLPARISTIESRPMKVVQTRPGCSGER